MNIGDFMKSQEYSKFENEVKNIPIEDRENLKKEINVIETSSSDEERESRKESVKNILQP